MIDPHHARDEYERAAMLVMNELALLDHPRASAADSPTAVIPIRPCSLSELIM